MSHESQNIHLLVLLIKKKNFNLVIIKENIFYKKIYLVNNFFIKNFFSLNIIKLKFFFFY